MLAINKKEFLEEFFYNEQKGLENLEKQIKDIKKEIHSKLIKYQNDFDIIENLIEIDNKTNKIKEFLEFLKLVNYLYVSAETNESFTKYFDNIQKLHYKVLIDLFNLLDI